MPNPGTTSVVRCSEMRSGDLSNARGSSGRSARRHTERPFDRAAPCSITLPVRHAAVTSRHSPDRSPARANRRGADRSTSGQSATARETFVVRPKHECVIQFAVRREHGDRDALECSDHITAADSNGRAIDVRMQIDAWCCAITSLLTDAATGTDRDDLRLRCRLRQPATRRVRQRARRVMPAPRSRSRLPTRQMRRGTRRRVCPAAEPARS